MKVDRVQIKGFRSLGDVDVKLSDYSSLIGKNDGGKSSFLHALSFLFAPNRTPSDSDICKIEGYGDSVLIQAELIECVGHEDLVVNDTIQVRRAFLEGKWLWEVLGEVPKVDTIKKIYAGTLNRGEWNSSTDIPVAIQTAVNQALNVIKPSGTIPSSVWKQVTTVLEDANLVEKETGWKPLDKDRLSSLVVVVMLEADVRCEEELADAGKSVFSQVGGLLLREAIKGNVELTEAVSKLTETVEAIVTTDENGTCVIPEVNEFNRIMQEEIRCFDTDVNTQSTIVPPKIPTFDFSVRIDISDKWVHGVSKMGHGLRRSVVFAMLRTHKRVRQQNVRQPEGTRTPLYLFLFEEPELYLHPQAELRRMEELQELATDSHTQVVLCTHSAIFVDLRKYHGILRFAREDRDVTNVSGWSGSSLSENAEKQLKLAYLFSANKAAMLFADLVILVEGQTEKTMLPTLAKKLGCYSQNVEIVDCGGNQGIPTFQRVLEGFGIKYVVWVDRDMNHNNSDSTLIACQRIRQAMSPKAGKMVVVNNDWEDLTGVPIGDKPYNSWKFFIDEENGINSLTESKIRAAYGWEGHEDEEFI